MATTDITKNCVERECGKQFVITEGEQKFYESKNLKLPNRCKPCRDKRRVEQRGHAFTN